MTRCLSLTEIVHLHESGDAPEEARRHLDGCATCRQAYDDLGEADALVDDIRSSEQETRQLGRAHLPSVGGHEIVREIGRGGMGVVYEAVQPHLDRHVALKVLPPLLHSLKPDSEQRFKAEAAAAASLQHAGIVPIYGYGEEDGCHYYVMELIRGVPLSDVIRRYREHPESPATYYVQVARWMANVADALHFAHERGVIHRDIKPSNLILSENNAVLITDFGLAKDTTNASVTRSGGLMGTWRYMSPEQARAGKDIDRRTDVYSLGATLYELLTLQPAISGHDDHEILRNVIDEQPQPPRRVVRAVPRDLETVCMTALSKEAAHRYATAAELADDLRHFIDGRPIRARKPELRQRLWMVVRQNRLLVTIFFTGLVAAATLWLATAYMELRREHAELNVQHAAALMTRGRGELESGQFFIAASVFERALAHDPSLTYAYPLMARAHAGAGEFAAATADLDQAIAVLRKRDDLLITRGVLHLLNRLPQAAASDFAAAAAIQPQRRDAWVLQCIAERPADIPVVPAQLTDDPLVAAITARLAERTSDDALWAACTDDEQRALAACLLGDLADRAGDVEAARTWFKLAADTEVTTYAVKLLATWRGASNPSNDVDEPTEP